MAMMFKLSMKPGDSFRENVGANEEPLFAKLSGPLFWAVIAYCDHYSPFLTIFRDLEDQDRLVKILTRAGFNTGPNMNRNNNPAKVIIDGNNKDWNKAIEKYKELQGVGSLEALGKAHLLFTDFMGSAQKMNPDHMRELRMIISQGIMVKIERQKYELITKSYMTNEQGDNSGSEDTREDDDESGAFNADDAPGYKIVDVPGGGV